MAKSIREEEINSPEKVIKYANDSFSASKSLHPLFPRVDVVAKVIGTPHGSQTQDKSLAEIFIGHGKQIFRLKQQTDRLYPFSSGGLSLFLSKVFW